MPNEIASLKLYIKDLENRINWAAEQLHSLANEQIHRSLGAPFDEIDADDLEEVVDILKGKIVK